LCFICFLKNFDHFIFFQINHFSDRYWRRTHALVRQPPLRARAASSRAEALQAHPGLFDFISLLLVNK
jgi:hypothetical protein